MTLRNSFLSAEDQDVLDTLELLPSTLRTPKCYSHENRLVVRVRYNAIAMLRKMKPELFKANDRDILMLGDKNYFIEIVDVEEYNKALTMLQDMYRL